MMRGIATSHSARGLNDDAAILEFGGESLILTHDMMVAGVHWLPHADPADVAWKLVAVNLSDLAAKGAEPLGVLLGYTLGDSAWDARFAAGLKEALAHFGATLLGGDTVGAGGIEKSIGMTALGRATYCPVPSRAGAKAGDYLYVTGHVGDAKAGFDLESKKQSGSKRLHAAFNRPLPRIQEGQALAASVNAMMDISDGLLLDAQRMAAASGLSVEIEAMSIPVSAEYISLYGDTVPSKIAAASWGDDYEILFALPPDLEPVVPSTCIGHFFNGEGLQLTHDGTAIELPSQIGFQHQ